MWHRLAPRAFSASVATSRWLPIISLRSQRQRKYESTSSATRCLQARFDMTPKRISMSETSGGIGETKNDTCRGSGAVDYASIMCDDDDM